jgi:hypothetical protein
MHGMGSDMKGNAPSHKKSPSGTTFFSLLGGTTAPLYDLIEKRAPVLEFLKYPEKYESLFRAL